MGKSETWSRALSRATSSLSRATSCLRASLEATSCALRASRASCEGVLEAWTVPAVGREAERRMRGPLAPPAPPDMRWACQPSLELVVGDGVWMVGVEAPSATASFFPSSFFSSPSSSSSSESESELQLLSFSSNRPAMVGSGVSGREGDGEAGGRAMSRERRSAEDSGKEEASLEGRTEGGCEEERERRGSETSAEEEVSGERTSEGWRVRGGVGVGVAGEEEGAEEEASEESGLATSGEPERRRTRVGVTEVGRGGAPEELEFLR